MKRDQDLPLFEPLNNQDLPLFEPLSETQAESLAGGYGFVGPRIGAVLIQKNCVYHEGMYPLGRGGCNKS